MDYVYTSCNNVDGDSITIFVVTASVGITNHSITFGICITNNPPDAWKYHSNLKICHNVLSVIICCLCWCDMGIFEFFSGPLSSVQLQISYNSRAYSNCNLDGKLITTMVLMPLLVALFIWIYTIERDCITRKVQTTNGSILGMEPENVCP